MRLLPPLATCLVLLTGCSDGGPDNAEPSGSPAPTGLEVQATIDIGDGEAYGLAITADSVWATSYAGGTAAQVDPATDTVTKTVDLGRGAASVLAVGDTVWVAGYGGAGGGPALMRIDEQSGEVTTYDVDALCCDLAVEQDLIWGVDPAGKVLSFDAEGKPVRTYDVEVGQNVHVNGVAIGSDYWVSSDSTPLTRIDTANGKAVELTAVQGVPFLARDGLVWGASTDEVWAIDAVTGEVAERLDVPDSIEVLSLEITDADVFVGIRHPGRIGAVLDLDRETGDLEQELDVDIPARLALGFGSLWVTDSGSDKLLRIGPVS